MERSLAALMCLLGLPAVLGCTGYVNGSGDGLPGGAGSDGASSNGGPPGTVTQASNPDAVTLLTNPPAEPVAAEIACTAEAVVPRGRLWRLSASNYKNSVKDTLG